MSVNGKRPKAENGKKAGVNVAPGSDGSSFIEGPEQRAAHGGSGKNMQVLNLEVCHKIPPRFH